MSDVGGHRVDMSGWQPLTESDVYEQVTHANDSSVGQPPDRHLQLGLALYSLYPVR